MSSISWDGFRGFANDAYKTLSRGRLLDIPLQDSLRMVPGLARDIIPLSWLGLRLDLDIIVVDSHVRVRTIEEVSDTSI